MDQRKLGRLYLAFYEKVNFFWHTESMKMGESSLVPS